MDQYNNTVTLYDESIGEYYTVKVENEDRKYEVENSNR